MVDLPSSALPLGSYPPGTTRLEAWVGHTIKKKSKRHDERKNAERGRIRKWRCFGRRALPGEVTSAATVPTHEAPSRSRSGAPTLGPGPVTRPLARMLVFKRKVALGPKLAQCRRGKLRTGTATLPLLYTPPRLVPSPGALTERQHGTVGQVKTAVLSGPRPEVCAGLARAQTERYAATYAGGPPRAAG